MFTRKILLVKNALFFLPNKVIENKQIRLSGKKAIFALYQIKLLKTNRLTFSGKKSYSERVF